MLNNYQSVVESHVLTNKVNRSLNLSCYISQNQQKYDIVQG